MVPEDWARPNTASSPPCCTISSFPNVGPSSPKSGGWHPINGSSLAGVGDYAGDIFFYGFGPSYQLVNRENIKFAPVVELFGWYVLGGRETVASVITPPATAADASGIRKVRQALKDDPDKPRFVHTVSGKGYRFVTEKNGRPETPELVEWRTPRTPSGPDSSARASEGPPDITRCLGTAAETPETPGSASIVSGQTVIVNPSYRWIKVLVPALLIVIVIVIVLTAILDPSSVRERWLAGPSATGQGLAIKSLAVLPCANASNSSEMDYLGNSLSEEITNSLSRISTLQVMACSGSSHYKSQDDPQVIGRNLHVEAILTGRVVEHGSELSLEAELVDVSSGAQLWGKRYTRNFNQASLLQTDVIHDIVAILRPRLVANAGEDLARVGTTLRRYERELMSRMTGG